MSVTAGVILAAPASGSGKTVVTLAVLRAFRRRGRTIASAKCGPDYIDPAFHTAATGQPCLTLDSWAMPAPAMHASLRALGQSAALVLVEGVMGLFDGAIGPKPGPADGSTAALAQSTGLPVVLIIDMKGMAASAAALLQGFSHHRPDVRIVGVILNRVGSPRHGDAATKAIQAYSDVPVLGAIPRNPGLTLPERHLGLVQARENSALETFLDQAATIIEAHLDLDRLADLASPIPHSETDGSAWATPLLDPPGQRIALADDAAFAFSYPGVLAGWRAAGAEILPFSPLANDAPREDADAVWLPGGYPELHAATLAANAHCLAGLRRAAEAGCPIIGECGGYMLLGRCLTDAAGETHAMAGLLPVETAFCPPHRRLHLGYRRATLHGDAPGLGRTGTVFSGHEFHYAGIVQEDDEHNRLFTIEDAGHQPLAAIGHQIGSVSGSFLHLICRYCAE